MTMSKKKYIETPEKLWNLFDAYVLKVKLNPFKIKDWVGKDGGEVTREKEKPLTMVGFECFVFMGGLNGDLSHYFSNYEERYTDYLTICSRIKKCITADQIEGGMAGIYNPSITQRLNGLHETVQNNITSVPILNIDPLAGEEKK